MALQSFSFTGSVSYSRDCIGAAFPISSPTWPAPTSGVYYPQIGYAGDHAIYVAGDTMAGTAVFTLTPPPLQPISGVYVQGTTAAGTFKVSGVNIAAGASTFPAAVTSDTPLASGQTQFFNPLNFNWSIAQAGTSCTGTYGCAAVGSSANPVYVTLARNVLPPPGSPIYSPVMLTYVKLAVGNGGAINQATALANTWAQFSTGGLPGNVVTWDGRSLQYYTAGFNSCASNAQMVVENVDANGIYTSSAQCGAFALLLESALAMNGIHSNWTQIQAAYSDPTYGRPKMVIKNWCLTGMSGCAAGPPSYPSQSPWIYHLTLNVGDYMVPTPAAGYGDLTNLQGVPGQGENATTSPPYTPLEKVFDFHFIVQVSTLDDASAPGNQYYDPSYGVTYPSAAGFETQAVAGYALQFPPDVLALGDYHVFIPIPGSPDILFITVPSRSM